MKHRAGKHSHEIVVEKLSSTAIIDDMQDEWLACINVIEELSMHDYVSSSRDMQSILEFLEEFKIESERAIAVTAFGIEPRSCGSCHMLARNFVDSKLVAKNLKCVYENGPEFDFGAVAKWFKLCEHYVHRVD